MADEQQMRLNLEDLRHLQSVSKRLRVASLLASEIRSLEAKLSAVTATMTGAKVSAEKAPLATTFLNSYITLSSFSWDQDNDKIKIYVFLEGVNAEKLETIFKTMSVDIKFHDIQGKNYRCVIPKLSKEIVPEKCKVVVKPTKVIITLVKASKGNWPDLHFKEDKLKPNLDKEKDPTVGIMDLMKNMYDDGDDDMKQTIAKARSDARSGKAADPLSKNF